MLWQAILDGGETTTPASSPNIGGVGYTTLRRAEYTFRPGKPEYTFANGKAEYKVPPESE